MNFSKEEIEHLTRASMAGDALQEAMRNGAIDKVFEEFNDKAFKIWKTVPAEDANAVMEAQMMGKVADSIIKSIQSRIEEGKGALQTLNQMEETNG